MGRPASVVVSPGRQGAVSWASKASGSGSPDYAFRTHYVFRRFERVSSYAFFAEVL